MATIPEAITLALEHHQAGRLQAAEQIYRQILAAEPQQPDALHLLGVLLFQTGHHAAAIEHIGRAIALKADVASFHCNLGEAYRALGKLPEAEACYHRALELMPGSAEAHSNLGATMADQGELEEAVSCFRRALALKPEFAAAHFNLGNTLKRQAKLDDAIACYRRALELNPRHAEAHCNLGVAFKEKAMLGDAIACYRQALTLRPDCAEALCNLGDALHHQGNVDEAIACCRRALELKPDYAAAYNNLACSLWRQGKFEEASASCAKALALRPDYAEAHNNLANALHEEGKSEEAVASYRRALELKPDYLEAQGNLGGVLAAIGDFQAAESSFRAALRSNPRFAFAHAELAKLLGGRLSDDDLAAQQRLLEDKALANPQRLLLHFGLAQVLDARGRYREAAEHLAHANQLQLAEWRKRGQEYDPQDHESRIDRIMEVCTPEFFARVYGFGLESDVPVFVFGLPRSGTTLVEQILAAHPQVFAAGEVKFAGDSFAALGENGQDAAEGLRRLDRTTAQGLAMRHLDRLRALSGSAHRIVDKMPDNYMFLGLLACLFPRAKLIYCRRDLRDVAVSCWMTHFQTVRWANDPRHIATRFCQHQRIMEHWRNVLPVPMLEIDYEETVADLEGVGQKLTAWCGLDWDPACLNFHRAKRPIRTASTVQVRRPVYRTSVGRWRHYEPYLAELFHQIPNGNGLVSCVNPKDPLLAGALG